jgi:hypothetical protein
MPAEIFQHLRRVRVRSRQLQLSLVDARSADPGTGKPGKPNSDRKGSHSRAKSKNAKTSKAKP